MVIVSVFFFSSGDVTDTPVNGWFAIQVDDLIPAIVKANSNTDIVGCLIPGIGDRCIQLAAGQSAARGSPGWRTKSTGSAGVVWRVGVCLIVWVTV